MNGAQLNILLSGAFPLLTGPPAIDDETLRTFVRRLAYADLWSVAPGWNYLTEQNAEASAALLCELIKQIAELHKAIVSVLR